MTFRWPYWSYSVDTKHFLTTVFVNRSYRSYDISRMTDIVSYVRPTFVNSTPDAYSAEQVLLNKQQIWGGGACIHCYLAQHE